MTIHGHLTTINPLLSNSVCSSNVEASTSSLGRSRCTGRSKCDIIHVEASPRGRGIDLGSLGLCTVYESPGRKKALGNETKRDRNSRVTCWSQYRLVMELQEQKLTFSISWGFQLRFLCFCNHRSYSKIISSLIFESTMISDS